VRIKEYVAFPLFPFPGCFLPREDKATGARARELNKASSVRGSRSVRMEFVGTG
jgi:hypothetical protein